MYLLERCWSVNNIKVLTGPKLAGFASSQDLLFFGQNLDSILCYIARGERSMYTQRVSLRFRENLQWEDSAYAGKHRTMIYPAVIITVIIAAGIGVWLATPWLYLYIMNENYSVSPLSLAVFDHPPAYVTAPHSGLLEWG